MTSGSYRNLMEIVVVPLVHNSDKTLIFQQDNASVHVKGDMVRFFEILEINVLEWLSCSPDHNPSENLWGWMIQ